jgi:hypothetical protein
MNPNQTQFDWVFGLQWFLVSVLGLALGGMLGFVSLWSVGAAVESITGETTAYIIGGALFGAIIALGANIGPGLLLQSHGIPGFHWVIASAVAGAIGIATGATIMIAFPEPDVLPEAATGAIIGISLGLPMGLGQWLVLRQRYSSTGAWVLISSLAFVIGMVIGLPLGGEGREWLSLGTIGLLVGAITSLGMVWTWRWRIEPGV